MEKLKSGLHAMRMLDIGIGGGRTTQYFAPLAKEYIGIDFDSNMILACEKRFPNRPQNISFVTCDARSMNLFPNGRFDFILFSFNGIDYLNHQERLNALREINRVGRKGGYFFFSTHNLSSIDRLFTLREPGNPAKFWKALCKQVLLRLLNKNIKKLKTQQYALISDGNYYGRLERLTAHLWRGLGYYYYCKPEEQVRQLLTSGFKIVEIYSLEGKMITSEAELRTTTDYWLH
ncbi:MAG: class I SAM-dependent methyltransferase, partial [Nitrososphaera sp.]